MRFSKLICLAAAVAVLPITASAQSGRVYSTAGVGVVTSDPDAGAAVCAEGTAPVILSLALERENAFRLSSPPYGKERRETSTSEVRINKGGIPVRKTKERTRLGVNFDRTFPNYGPAGQVAVEARFAGCLSETVFTVRGGTVAVQGRTRDYALVLQESLESLADARQAGVRIWLKRVVYRAGPKDVNVFLPLPRDEGYETMPYVGEVQLNTSDFDWRYPALEQGRPALNGALKLDLSFNLLDAR